VKEAAEIEINLFRSEARYLERTYGERMGNREAVEWAYATADGWREFDEVRVNGNRLILKKGRREEIAEREVHGRSNRWLRCRVRPQMLPEVSTEQLPIEIDGLQVKTQYLDEDQVGGIPPEQLFFNDIQVDAQGCYPFGEMFAPYAILYLANHEVFSKKDALITLAFRLKHETHRLMPDEEQEIQWKMIMKESDFPKKPKVYYASVLQVHWEYWNGKSWVRLLQDPQAEAVFHRPPAEAEERTITFRCPEDLAETYVNGHSDYWIRVRVHHVENLYASNPVYLSPWIENVRLQYRYFPDQTYPVENCLTVNNLEWTDRTEAVTDHPQLFAPFAHLEGEHPAFYMGFDKPPAKGPIQIYFPLLSQRLLADDLPIIEWEYLCRTAAGNRWTPLKVVDETLGFTRSGVVQFAGPSDFAQGRLFQRDLYWLRAVNRDGRFDRTDLDVPRPVLAGIHLNTVRITQQESILRETPRRVRISDTEEQFVLANLPVFTEEVWVDETGRLTDNELDQLLEADLYRTDIYRDSGGKILKLLVLWQAVDHFDHSRLGDRHYTIDRSTGVIRFGDGKQGKVPPDNGPDAVLVSYKKIVGKRGNVPAGQINTLPKTIAYVQGVSNPEPTGGGSEIEPLQRALERGPQQIRHRDRAITAQDYEWLARQAYQDIAKVKCLSNFNARMERENGCITLVALPKGGSAGRQAFPTLKRQVESYLIERSANTIARPGRISVIEPAYLMIMIFAHLVVASMDLIVQVEREADERISAFLNPYTGNYDGKGWEIGQALHGSEFYGLLKQVPGVNYVKKLSMTVMKHEGGEAHEILPEDIQRIPHGIVVSGSHQIIVDLLE
ncbi:MAG: putative baseplate assembly protein, partial [Tumebacillaceae bacterium]